MDMLDRVFGSCFRSWVVGKENGGDSKYIDYLPTRKWKYSDHNLMKDLSENNGCDVMDLADDVHGQTSSNIKLRLHDNVFLNPLNEATSHDVVNESTESEEIIMEHNSQLITEENNNTIDHSKDIPNIERKPSLDVYEPTNDNNETVNDSLGDEKAAPNGDDYIVSEDKTEPNIENDNCCLPSVEEKTVTNNDEENPVTNDDEENPVTNDDEEKPVTNDDEEKPVTNDDEDKPVTNNDEEKPVTNNDNSCTQMEEEPDQDMDNDECSSKDELQTQNMNGEVELSEDDEKCIVQVEEESEDKTSLPHKSDVEQKIDNSDDTSNEDNVMVKV